ncbi:MAG: hypothetical protein R3A46_19245 [Thermomicrobiales bacterium]
MPRASVSPETVVIEVCVEDRLFAVHRAHNSHAVGTVDGRAAVDQEA